MRTLSSTLTSAQEDINKAPIWKIVLSRTSQTTRGYNSSRIIKISRTEEPNSHKADITLHNTDGALTSLNFEHYQAVISKGYKTSVARTAWAANTAYAIDDIRVPTTTNGYQYRCSVAGTSHATTEPTWGTALGVTQTDGTVTWEMDGNSGDEYSRAASLRVRVQETYSGMGIARCILRCIGLQDQLKEDKAIAEYTQESTDTNTVKTLISAVCAASTGLSSAYNGYAVITVVYDSEDSLIDVFKPADYFSISMNENRWDKITELLGYTGCKARFENDNKLHVFDPTISGSTYNYEYKWNVSGDHLFWNKSIRLRFVNPNKVIVRTPSDYATQYTGSATSATSNALAEKTRTVYARVVSNAQCDSIAAAMIEQLELDDEKGIVSVPPNVGQELWDYVKVTDSILSDTNTGNIQYISDDIEVFPNTNQRATWRMLLSFGKVTQQSLQRAASMGATKGATKGATGEEAGISNLIIQIMESWINQLIDFISVLDNRVDKLEAQTMLNIFASVAQTSAGLVLNKAVTPNSLAVSERGSRILAFALNGATALTTSDKAYQRIATDMDGFKLIKAEAMVKGASTSGAVTLTVKNGATSMLTTNITIDVNETDTLTAATPPVVDAANDDVAIGDQIEVACSGAGTGVTWCVAVLTFILDV